MVTRIAVVVATAALAVAIGTWIVLRQTTGNSYIAPKDAYLALGGGIGGMPSFFGTVTDVQFYRSSLNTEQAKALYSHTSAETLKPIGHWELDEGKGTEVVDASGHGLTGTLSGASWAPNERREALFFRNPTDTVFLTNSPLLDSPDFSLSLWIKLISWDPAGNWRNIIVGREIYLKSGFRLGISKEYKIYFWTTESGGTIEIGAVSPIPTGIFNNILITFDHSLQRASLYVDGVLSSQSQ
jgi:hypothetical protein